MPVLSASLKKLAPGILVDEKRVANLGSNLSPTKNFQLSSVSPKNDAIDYKRFAAR